MEKILVIKHGALGDIVQAMDAFESLRQSFVHAHITVLTAPAFAPLLQNSHWFDKVVSDPRLPIWHIASTLRLIRLFRQPFDGIIDLQCSRRTASYFKIMRPKARWFGTVPGCSDPMPDFKGVHNRERMLTAVYYAGAKRHEASLDWLKHNSPPLSVDLPARFAVFIAGSSAAKPSKRWPARAYAELGAACLARGITPLLCGTSEDKAVNDQIAMACKGAIDLTGQTSLAQLAAIFAQAEFTLGNDTGPVFLAARTGQPTLMVMGPDTNPDMSAPTGPQASFIKAESLPALSPDTVLQDLQKRYPGLGI